jgi:hypothetical protein
MSTLFEIRNWLEIAFCEPVDRINESYYFDKRNCEFFSVFITDYFLTDPNDIEEYADSPYSKEELATLFERIERIEDNSTFLISIPSLTVQERKEMMYLFVETHNSLDKNELQIIVESENGRTNLDFNQKLVPEINEDWYRFKYDYIQNKADSFCNLNGIDLDTSSLWTDRKMTSMSLNIKDTIPPDHEKSKNPWWKFW